MLIIYVGLAIIFFIGLCCCLAFFDNVFCMFVTLMFLILGMSCVIGINKELKKEENRNTYYLEAEVLAVDDTNNITVFATEQGKYSVDGTYYDNSPYLLTVDSMGTKSDTNDDKILVVWKAE